MTEHLTESLASLAVGRLSSATSIVAILSESYGYLDASPALAAAFGTSRGELLGTGLPEFHGKRAFEAQLRPFIDEALAGAVTHARHSVTLPDGTHRAFDSTWLPLPSSPTPSERRVLWIGTDAEDGAQARSRAQLHSMARGIAHDYNNLLVGILGGVELAFHDTEPESDIRRDLELIRRAADRARGLTDSLLAFTTGRGLSPQPVALNELAQQATREALARNPKYDAEFELEPSLAPLNAVAAPVRQVVGCLVANAIQALEGPDVKPCVRTGVAAADDPEGEGVWILQPTSEVDEFQYVEVADRGCGIPGHLLERSFQPFFTTRTGASGLGLAAVVGLMEQAGGAIRIHSQIDHGTTVRLLFPASGEPADLPATPARPPRRVLVVDDDEAILELVSLMLGSRGCEAVTAQGGSAALEIFEQQADRIDAVLIDVNMPGIDGLETLERMRRIEPGVRAVLTSGGPFEGRPDQEPVPFLHKPFTTGELLASLSAPAGAPPG